MQRPCEFFLLIRVASARNSTIGRNPALLYVLLGEEGGREVERKGVTFM